MEYFTPNNNFAINKNGNNDQSILKSSQIATHPSQESYISKKTLVVDSRQRDVNSYKNPSFYKIELGNVYKNITSVELKGAIIPKSSFNIHTSNNKIDFSIGDFISSIYITDKGSGYTVAPSVTISLSGGVNAVGTAIINASGQVTNIIVNVSGTGYSTSRPPFVFLSAPRNGRTATAFAVVGNIYTAILRPGQYTIGGNNVPGTNEYPTGLLLEIQNAMNYVVNGGNYNPTSSSPFAVRLVSQYPTLGAVAGSSYAYDTNSALFGRLQFTNINSAHWEFLFSSGSNRVNSANSVLGFNINDAYINYATTDVNVLGGTLIPAGTTIRADFDYNLNDDPEYVIMELRISDFNCERIESKESSLDRKFGILIFDNNNADCIQDQSGTTTIVNDVKYLQGAVTKGTFWKDPGKIKALKGYDFDSKKLSFTPPEGKISSITVSFSKFGQKKGGVQEFYDFEGREHTLIFELTAGDQFSKQKD
jgi:hypothetical protein